MNITANEVAVQLIVISPNNAGQRLDNFLFTALKGVPKSRIYRIIRKGEVRVNKGRIKPEYKLAEGDQVRIPPVRVAQRDTPIIPSQSFQDSLEASILYEDDLLLVINKPSGLAVHGGSGISLGLIEALRATRSDKSYLELVHRIDRDTSGCLVVAKKRSALRFLQDEMRARRILKVYYALASGRWPRGRRRIDAPLLASEQKSGEKIVRVDSEGKSSVTVFSVVQRFDNATLMEATLETGRTHQIRVHAQYVGCSLAGDVKYGSDDYNDDARRLGLGRMFLHALRIQFFSPCGKKILIEAPIPPELSRYLQKGDH